MGLCVQKFVCFGRCVQMCANGVYFVCAILAFFEPCKTLACRVLSECVQTCVKCARKLGVVRIKCKI